MASFPGQLLLEDFSLSQSVLTRFLGALRLETEADGELPQILNINPPPGDPVYANSAVSFELKDSKALRLVEIQVDQKTREVVYDGESFLYPYLASTRVVIDSGKHFYFQVRRTGGWIVTPVWRIRALDSGFNEPLTP